MTTNNRTEYVAVRGASADRIESLAAQLARFDTLHRSAMAEADRRLDAAERELAACRADAERLRRIAVTFACSRHLGKCYVCDTTWSPPDAPDIHTPNCPLAREGHTQ